MRRFCPGRSARLPAADRPCAWGVGGVIKLKGDAKFRGVQDHEAAKDIPTTYPRMNGDAGPELAIPASQQDQVIIQPPNTEIVAASGFTAYAALAWTDRPAISFQFHPEFSPAFAKALIEKRYDIVPEPDAAIASLDAPNDNARVAAWIRSFLEA